MPYRFHVSIGECMRFDSRLSRHAFARTSTEKMQRERQTGPPTTQTPPVAASLQDRPRDDSLVDNLSLSFEQTLTTTDHPRLPLYAGVAPGVPFFFSPAPRQPAWQPWWQNYRRPDLNGGRGFHTTRCNSPQFSGQRQPFMPRHDKNGDVMVPSLKRTWEGNGKAAYSAERNRLPRHSSYLPAEEYKGHHRSKSCDGLESNRRRPVASEKFLREEVARLRRWELTEFGREHSIKPKAGLEFTIMTYNILAQCLLENNDYLYKHCDPEVLLWEFRKERILKELVEANADILCLQEVQSNRYDDFFVPELGKLGYVGRYKKRTGDKNDGCAIFFKDHLFTLENFTTVEYAQPGLSLCDRDRDNIALVAMLKPKKGGRKICVANTHLLFNPGRGDIKLAQLRILLAEIDKFAYHRLSHNRRKPLYHPVILCGDMNSEPNCSLYEFVSTGTLMYEGLMAGDISGQAEGIRKGRFCLEKELIPEELGISDQCQYVDTINSRMGNGNGQQKMDRGARGSANHGENASSSSQSKANADEQGHESVFSSGKMTHGLNFVSAYEHHLRRVRGGQTAVTTHHRKGSCMVDYIFYSVHSKNSKVKKCDGGKEVEHQNLKNGSLSLLATYGLLSGDELTCLGGLPNGALPSDHLALIARFLLQDDS